MKKIYVLSMFLLIIFAGLVQAQANLTYDGNTRTLTSNPGVEITDSLNIENTGNESTFADLSGVFTKGSDDLTMSPQNNINFAANDTTSVSISIPSSENAETTPAGNYGGDINVSYDGQSVYVPVVITITEQEDFEVTQNRVELQAGPMGDDTASFNLENTGNTASVENLDITFNQGNFRDSDGNNINLSFSQRTGISVGDTTNSIQVTAEVPEEMRPSTYTGTITISNGNVEDTFALDVEVRGYLEINDIDLDEDELKPGEEFEFTVELENNADDDDFDMEVDLEVWLSDSDNYDDDDIVEDEDDDEIEDDSSFDLDEGEDEGDVDDDDVTFTFRIPRDAEDGDEFYVQAKAVGEDDNGDDHIATFVSDVIDIEQENYELIVERFDLVPATVSCSDSFEISFETQNIGSKDVDDARVQIRNDDLNINILENLPELEADYDDDDSKYEKNYRVTLPEDVSPGQYFIGYDLEYDDADELISGSKTFTVNECTIDRDDEEEEEQEEQEEEEQQEEEQ